MNPCRHRVRRRKRRSFALAEVCVAIGVVGICIAYVFSTMHQTIKRYATLRAYCTCEAIADEQLARTLATWVTTPPEFSEATEGWAESGEAEGYTIHMNAQPNAPLATSSTDTSKEIKKKACLLTVSVTVTAPNNTQIKAERSVNLCILKEGT